MPVISTDTQQTICRVYWLHTEDQADIFSEGYVGITVKPVSKRFIEHKSASKNGSNLIVHKAIRKYGDALICEELLVGDVDYCLEIENKLRPSPNIGWNLAIGGSKTMLGFKHSEQTRLLISKQFKNKPLTEQHAEKIRNNFKGKKHTEEVKEFLSLLAKERGISDKTRDAAKKANSSLMPWENPNADTSTWKRADIFYSDYISQEVTSPYFLGKKHGVPHSKLVRIWKEFSKGWNPSEDEDWFKFKLKE